MPSVASDLIFVDTIISHHESAGMRNDGHAALKRIEEQLEAQAQAFEKQHVRHMEDARFYDGKIGQLQEQLEAAQRERDSLAARLRAQGYNVTEILAHDAALNPASERHGRGCPCTPCQAEDWDKVDALLAPYGRRTRDVSNQESKPWARPPESVSSPSPEARIAAALERIAAALERLTEQNTERKP